MTSQHKTEQLSALIKLLADGLWHKGPELADKLAVSRAYVWKLLQQLQEYGLCLESISGKGYRLSQALALLDAKELAGELSPLGIESELLLLTDSTNLQLKQAEFVHKKLLVAEYQSSGRGRRGRQWVSPIAANLYWSYSWKSQMPVQQLGGLSLVVGISLVSALQELGINDVALKWPNDLRYQGKKLAGILVELSGDADGDINLVIGVGMNLQMDKSLGEHIEQEWTDLSEIAEQQAIELLNRQQVLLQSVTKLQQNLDLFESQGFSAFKQQWQLADEAFGEEVLISQANSELTGVGAGVDDNGAFLLQTKEQLETIYAGEVSLRIQS